MINNEQFIRDSIGLQKPKPAHTYVCKRMRMLIYFRMLGFMPYSTMPQCENPKFYIWLFDRDEEGFEEAMTRYFEILKEEKAKRELQNN